MKRVLAIVAVIGVIGLVAWAVLRSDDSQNNATQTPATTDAQRQASDAPANQTTPGATSQTNSTVKITYTDSGFQPSSVSIQLGNTVEITNQSSRSLQFASDPHPAHTENSDLNIGTIGSGQTKQLKLSTKGTWGYHNHLNSSHTGQLKVE